MSYAAVTTACLGLVNCEPVALALGDNEIYSCNCYWLVVAVAEKHKNLPSPTANEKGLQNHTVEEILV